MQLKPMADQVLVRLKPTQNAVKGGIFIPDAAQEKSNEGKVVAIGPKVADVKVGNRVLLPNYGGTAVKLEGHDCVLYHEKDIIGIIEEES